MEENQSQAFLDFALAALRRKKMQIIDKMSENATERIVSLSLGEMNPVVTRNEDGFVIDVQPGALDPTGAGLREIEEKTEAVASTAKLLGNKDYVASLINKAE